MRRITGMNTGRAPVDEADRVITATVLRRDAVCARLAAGEVGEDVIAELMAATQAVSAAQWEREEVIRRYFFRG